MRSATSSASGSFIPNPQPQSRGHPANLSSPPSHSGKIAKIDITTEGETKKAEVTFEKETASKTALLLNNTQLGPNHISVTSPSGANADEDTAGGAGEREDDNITQEEKPRARIFAEYLAHGYVIGDAAITRALELDQKHGMSSRFLTTLQGLDQKYHATDRAKATDQNYGISQRANSLFSGLNSYFEAAANHPTGKRIVQFYSDSSQQVQQVHAEARRLANLKKEESGGSAYKAAGLEKVFGKEKEKAQTEGGAAADPAAAAAPTEQK